MTEPKVRRPATHQQWAAEIVRTGRPVLHGADTRAEAFKAACVALNGGADRARVMHRPTADASWEPNPA